MRRMVVPLVATALLLASSSVALAATIFCDGGVCRGTDSADTLEGSEPRTGCTAWAVTIG